MKNKKGRIFKQTRHCTGPAALAWPYRLYASGIHVHAQETKEVWGAVTTRYCTVHEPPTRHRFLYGDSRSNQARIVPHGVAIDQYVWVFNVKQQFHAMEEIVPHAQIVPHARIVPMF